MRKRNIHRSSGALVAAAWAVSPLAGFAAVSSNSSNQPVQQGQTNGVNNPAETITFEGQGSLNKIIGNAAFGYLSLTGSSGTASITLNNGPGATAVTYSDTSTSSSAYLNLASQNFTAPDVGVNSPSTAQQTHSALRLEWHWNGTVDGSNDLVNDQIGYSQLSGPVSPQQGAQRGPTVANPFYINGTNHFDGTAAGSGTLNLVTLNGLSASNNSGLGTYNTYSSSNYDQAGNNLLGGMNRVQFAFTDNTQMDYSFAGTASVFATPGAAGYGQGNPALNTTSNNQLGTGVTQARQSYQSSSVGNMPTTNINPSTVSTSNPGGSSYAAGPWNTAGINNLSSIPIAANAVMMAANPGTGLSRLNKTDSQWIQCTSRLANGVAFNTVTRDADLGQRPSFATATGIDGTWAVGLNDGGNTTTSANAVAQHTIGTMRYSGKSSDTEVYNTIAQSRAGIGVLALTSTIAANSYAPVRALDIDFNDATDPQLSGGGTDDSQFVSANLNSISTGQYQAVLLGYATTVKAPNPTALANYEAAHPGLTDAQAWAQMSSFNSSNPSDATTTGIKGDTTGDVAKFISNLANSQASYQTLTTVNDPADDMLNNSYLPPNLLAEIRDPTTGILAANPNYNSASFNKATAIYGNKFNADLSTSFGKDTETIGASSYYGGAVGGGSPSSFNGAIAITAFNADGSAAADGTLAPGGNWLLGNFNQNGVRDLSATESALAAAKALYNVEPTGTSGANSAFSVSSGVANASNSTAVSYTDVNGSTHNMTKGDLIAMGDFQSDGRFDGSSLEALDRAAAASDASGAGYAGGTLSGGMSGFADSVRNGVLRKNAALQFDQTNTSDAAYNASGNPTNASAFLRQSGRIQYTGSSVPIWATQLSQSTTGGVTTYTYTYDPLGNNTFNERDVNQTGQINLNNAFVVDKFAGWNAQNLTQQLGAVINADGSINPSGTQVSIDLMNVAQFDSGSATTITQADENNIDTAGTGTLAGDAGLNSTLNYAWYSANKIGNLMIAAAPAAGSQFAVPTGSVFTISSGQFVAGGVVDLFTDNTNGSGGTIPGTHLSILNNSIGTDGTNGTTVSPYGLVISSTAPGGNNIGTLEGSGSTSVTSGASLTADHIYQSALSIAANSTVTIRSNGTPTGTSVLTDLSNSGTLDLKNNDLIVKDSTQFSAVRSAIISAYNSGAWNGVGITSSSAALHPNTYGLGYSTIGNIGTTTFDGQTGLASGTVLVKYTLLGDTKLTGSVGLGDYNTVLSNLNAGTLWSQGAFHPGTTTGLGDYNAVLANFNGAAGGSVAASSVKAPTATIRAAFISPSPAVVASNAVTDMKLEVNTVTGDVFAVATTATALTGYDIFDSSNNLKDSGDPNTDLNELLLSQPTSNRGNTTTFRNTTNYKLWTTILDNASTLAEGENNGKLKQGTASTYDTINVPSGGTIDFGHVYATATNKQDLTFSFSEADPTNGGNPVTGTTYGGEVDYVNSNSIPEPGMLGLLGLSRIMMMRRRRKTKVMPLSARK